MAESRGGRLKSDLRFSNTIVWNNLPLPAVDPSPRAKIIAAGEGVQVARDLQPDRSLAQLYASESMAAALVAAHDHLDELVDHRFGAKRTCASEAERQQVLFARYEELAAPLTAASTRRRR